MTTVTEDASPEVSTRRLDLLLDVPLEVTVELGRNRMTIRICSRSLRAR